MIRIIAGVLLHKLWYHFQSSMQIIIVEILLSYRKNKKKKTKYFLLHSYLYPLQKSSFLFGVYNKNSLYGFILFSMLEKKA